MRKGGKAFVGIVEQYKSCDNRRYCFCVYEPGSDPIIFGYLNDMVKYVKSEYGINYWGKITFKPGEPKENQKNHKRVFVYKFHSLNKLQRKQLKEIIRQKKEKK